MRPRRLLTPLALALALTSSLACEREPAVARRDPPSAEVEAGAALEGDDAGEEKRKHEQSTRTEVARAQGNDAGPIYDQLIAGVSGGVAPTAESESIAWQHYRAGDYAQAQIAFALASLHDREAWKHPFNLACVSARLRDEGLVRVGLTEAMARDAEATAAKARADGDLAAYRNAPWWEATVGARSARGEDERELELPSDAALAGPKLAEPSILPLGRNTPIAPARLEAVRAKLMELHGLYPQLRASLEFSDDAGALHGYVVYDFSVLDACMLDRPAAACFAEWGEDLEEGGGWDRSHCVHAYITRLSFASGSELEADERALSFGCGPANVYRLDLVDADGDGVDEIVIDIRSRAVVLGLRYTKDYISGRVFEVLRLDGSRQFAFEHDLRTYTIMDTAQLARRVVAKDVNKDGYLDFVIQSREIQANSRYPVDAEFWPLLSDARYREVGELNTEVRHYEPSKDRW